MDSLLKPLLGDYKPSNEDILHNSERKKLAENANVKAITRIAEFELEDTTLQVFDITLSSHSKIKYSKVNIQKVVRSIMDVYTGAIMFFHYENNEGDWRISFVEKEDSQKNTTSAKRYTFLVGENHPATTITQRFVTLRGKEKSVEAIRDAFSVEALSEEFFAKYKSHYEDFVQYISGKRFVKEKGKWVEKSIGQPSEEYISIFEENDKSVRDFVKKMLGRIVFLHFLQKKKWLCDDENYLQNLFKKSEKSNYLESVLEPLFFGVLNTKSEDRKVLFENENWDLSLLKEWGNIPYLNGGLFEKDELDKKTVVFPENLFSDLFDFFSQYNFTIDENDPNDSEVGIDPEMLGKIFENLLEDNKDKGAFYTPKEIVQYMCRESLIAYLCEKHKDDEEGIRSLVEHHIANWDEDKRNKILDSLKDVKICDPAIGSGAFPMGLLNELYQCRLALGEEKSVNIKKEIIQNNIYGVDIEKGAVDIARLRFWLALVVEEEIAEPLPNLDYKIMQGNSLLESYQGVDLSNLAKTKTEREKSNICVTLFDEQLDVHRFQLSEYIKEYFNCTNSDIKKELRKKIDENIRQQIEEQLISLDFSNINLSANSHFFLWHTYFGDVFNRANKSDNGFDIVIGNPPYGANIDNLTDILKKEYPETSKGYKDIYKNFYNLGINLVNHKGVVTYITPNTFFRQPKYGDLRRFLLKYKITQLLDLGENIFQEAVVPVGIIIISKNSSYDNTILFKDLTKQENKKDLQNIIFNTIKQDLFLQTSNNIFIENVREKKINEYTLDEILEMKDAGINYQRVKVGLKEKGKSDLSKRLLYMGNQENMNDVEYWKGEDIDNYFIKQNTNRFCRTNIHLYDNERVILNKDYFNIFPKLLWRQTAKYPICIIDNIGIWFGRSIQAGIIKNEFKDKISYEYLCGLLNSKYLRYIYENNVKESGRVFPQVKLEKLRSLPIIIIENGLEIENKVKEIISIKKENSNADTSNLENEIDILVYKMFNLTFDEVKVIDPNIENIISKQDYEKKSE